ncbi:hypothetical protein LG047_01085 [Methylocystis sp. WRRC1]|uniref:hypothetical protein n=1 Tax=Methylocystis sp. WRRC1 TaxID=1732014 RepID=UPI001D153917|nr:hypothetical protein [Methylocystis sp. WRRC1]MCC3243927.1 hypothetical protein [Methylocystis sp. WRRC1]
MKKIPLLALVTCVIASPAALSQTNLSRTTAGSLDWSWLKNTYWIVPPQNLPSLLFNPSSNVLLPAADQTVYHITDYRGGYFWGKNVTKVGRLPVACSSLVGSVTPTGRVLLSFTSVKSDGSESVQQGFGEMVLQGHAWTMLNQTSTSSFAHWAYMVQSKPGDASWRSLPGVRQSVPDFLAQCPGSGPQIGVR